MKKSILILFTLFSFHCFSQYTLTSTLNHDTILNKKFSIVFYIVDSINNVTTATPPVLGDLIDSLNHCFKHIGVSFENCSTVVIPNFPYSNWKKSVTDPVVTSNWYTDKTINFYIVWNILPEASNTEGVTGYTYPPPATSTVVPKDVIVTSTVSIAAPFSYVFHQMGHFFGLVHTYDELNTTPAATPGPPTGVTSQEYADGSNCSQHGDCLCDTEADPNTQTNPYLDGKGARYILPLDNYMSGYSSACRFTQQQFNLMAYTIYTKRLYLH